MALTIQDVMQVLTEPVERIQGTVDKLLFGDADAEVTGIATTFMPTQKALEEAASLGINLVIAHEAPFYSHHESFASSLVEDPVYLAKTELIHRSGIALFRFHDYIHRYQPDGITEGLIHALGWNDYVEERLPAATVVELPSMTVRQVAEHCKSLLGLGFVRLTGEPDMPCRRIGVLVGYRGGGATAIPMLERHRLDLLLYGEGPEWETPEYVRDANSQGRGKAAIVLGHAESEEAGMRRLALDLQARYPHINVRHLTNLPIYQIL